MKLIEIPKEFHSDATGEPFDRCVSCGRDLRDPSVHYFIEKAVRNYSRHRTTDTIFEYAICFDCYMEVHKSLSEESRERIDAYFLRNVNMLARIRLLGETATPDMDRWLSRCLIKGVDRCETSEYQIMCECLGDRMLLTFAPYLVSAEAMDEIAGLLSNRTLDALNGFYDDFIGMPPELLPLLKDQPHLIL
ncbi:MAG TPA: hypothetical protein ENN17_01750 [bacterium]|nr:hypothetical protein [bacterium]